MTRGLGAFREVGEIATTSDIGHWSRNDTEETIPGKNNRLWNSNSLVRIDSGGTPARNDVVVTIAVQ